MGGGGCRCMQVRVLANGGRRGDGLVQENMEKRNVHHQHQTELISRDV